MTPNGNFQPARGLDQSSRRSEQVMNRTYIERIGPQMRRDRQARWARQPVSRVLCRPDANARARRPFLWTGPCGTVLATNPDDSDLRRSCPPYTRGGRAVPIRSCSRRGLPCRPGRPVRGALLPHPFTLARRCTHARRAVCFLWRCPWDRSRRALPAALSPWSPDFPPPPREGRERPPGRLAQGADGPERHVGQARAARRVTSASDGELTQAAAIGPRALKTRNSPRDLC